MIYARISHIDLLTPMGDTLEIFFRELVKGKSAIAPNNRFDCSAFRSQMAALVPGISPGDRRSSAGDGTSSADNKTSLAQMFEKLITRNAQLIPEDTRLIFAATVGEIDRLEKALLNCDSSGTGASTLLKTASWLGDALGLKKPPYVVSAACASASAAVERAKFLIQSGKEKDVLVASADCVSEFVFSGFSALMAIDKEGARPFDRDRSGLTPGEAAGIILLTADDVPSEEHFYVAGAASSSDANHMTGPSRDGSGLARAVENALRDAGLQPGEIDFIAGHGTGTRYNDGMELKAYKKIFSNPSPLFSIKGAVGHTMGNAGLLQLAVSVQAMKTGTTPPSTGISNLDKEAVGWVHSVALNKPSSNALVANAGFGGINSALIVARGRMCHENLAKTADYGEYPIKIRSEIQFICSHENEKMLEEYQSLRVEESILKSVKNFKKFDTYGKNLFLAAFKLITKTKGQKWEPSKTAILVVDRDGALDANTHYFNHYLENGRSMGSPNKFIYTLPTSICAEIGICFGISGALLYMSSTESDLYSFALNQAEDIVHTGHHDHIYLFVHDNDSIKAAFITLHPGAENES
ncbi:Beta-ketoacyl synthase (modular protein) [Desulfamplus magnetovallimortis]|uniref:Beta-ketoacyl synthase (Modular protein) n=1 Tax=Desulfamplus magnetovallimortis TaxID=1246637 RepID=L0R5G5_9BACT|nr:beta-ketoacyl synthase N-terminal-like domain-containing protein [Desulfamplus magnetovallimortis]CCO06765.1 Beta-ketoacyl synthase (modular protein) [Desulfamplus magnetovallimortis BW-1]SLM32816.1 Beta-ketoacyl synthase (modular protein) [Desulfamplus magnetovallimortis]